MYVARLELLQKIPIQDLILEILNNMRNDIPQDFH